MQGFKMDVKKMESAGDYAKAIVHGLIDDCDSYDDALSILIQSILTLTLVLINEEATGTVHSSKYSGMNQDNGKCIRMKLVIDVIDKDDNNERH